MIKLCLNNEVFEGFKNGDSVEVIYTEEREKVAIREQGKNYIEDEDR